MFRRFLPVVAVISLVIAACSPSVSDSTTTSPSTTVPESTTTSGAPALEAAVLSYNLESGTSSTYRVDLDQQIEMTATGDSSAMGGEDIPGEASLNITGTATFTQDVSDGPEPGTYEVHVTGQFDDLNVSGTVDGEPVDEIPDFAGMDPIDVTFVVDEKGNVIPESGGLEDPFGGALGDLGSLESGGFALDPGQFVGPPLTDGEVAVGDTWSEEIETPMLGDDPVVTTITSTVTGTDEIEGNQVFVIETQTATSPIHLDLGEFFIGLFGAFTPDDATDEEAAQLQDLLDEFLFVLTVDATETNSTTWFDPITGAARKFAVDGSTTIGFDVNLPDDATGEMVAFNMSMAMNQQVTYELLGSPGA